MKVRSRFSHKRGESKNTLWSTYYVCEHLWPRALGVPLPPRLQLLREHVVPGLRHDPVLCLYTLDESVLGPDYGNEVTEESCGCTHGHPAAAERRRADSGKSEKSG